MSVSTRLLDPNLSLSVRLRVRVRLSLGLGLCVYHRIMHGFLRFGLRLSLRVRLQVRVDRHCLRLRLRSLFCLRVRSSLLLPPHKYTSPSTSY